jgi:hypothetical protein
MYDITAGGVLGIGSQVFANMTLARRHPPISINSLILPL